MERLNKKAASGNLAAFNTELHCHLTVEAYNLRALGFVESELIASRLRWRYGDAWRAS
jgi:hypothetical protein